MESDKIDRGRKPRDGQQDHIREYSPERQPTAEARGRKSKDTSKDHVREYSPERQGQNNSEDSHVNRQRSNERHGGHRQRSNERHGDRRHHSNERNGGQRKHSKERYSNDNRQQNYYQNDGHQGNYWHGGQDRYRQGDQGRGRGRYRQDGQGGYGQGGQNEYGQGGQDGYGQVGYGRGGRGRFQQGRQYDYEQNHQGAWGYQGGQQKNYHNRYREGGNIGHWQPDPQTMQQQGAQNWKEQGGYEQGQRKRYRDRDPVVHLSKSLSFVLRHGAEKKGFKLMPGGFLWVDELLGTRDLEGYTEEDVKYVVQSNDKQRFSLEQDSKTGRLKIRANQGHSMEVEGLELTPITDAKETPIVIHGTYFQSWEIIKREGLNKMGRNHIHFAEGEPGENGVISGMRSSCEVMIFIDMEKAMAEGIKFFRSANNVILSPGDKQGYIRPCFFKIALQRYPRSPLPFDGQVSSGPPSPNIPGLAVSKKKKQKKKHKDKKDDEKSQSVEGKIKTDMEDVHLSGTLLDDKMEVEDTQEVNMKTEAPENWDDEMAVKEEEATKQPVPVKEVEMVKETQVLDELTEVSDPDCCQSAIEELKSASLPVLVYCHMKDEKIRSILCVNKRKAFNFILADDESLIKDGGLKDFIEEKKCKKVFHGIAVPAKALFDQFTILLDGTDLYDTKVGCERVHESGQGNLSEIPFEFDPETDLHFKGESLKELEEDVLKKCAVILETYDILSKFFDKATKKEIFTEANSLIDEGKKKEEALKRKKEREEKKKQEKQQDPKKQSHQNQNKKQGKKK